LKIEEVIQNVLARATQGMTDDQILAYLNWIKSKTKGDVIKQVKKVFQDHNSNLYKNVCELRDKALAEWEKEKERQKAGETVEYDEYKELWYDEQRYKRSLIPEGSHSSKSGRKRKSNKECRYFYPYA
jgi:hypothetical protein